MDQDQLFLVKAGVSLRSDQVTQNLCRDGEGRRVLEGHNALKGCTDTHSRSHIHTNTQAQLLAHAPSAFPLLPPGREVATVVPHPSSLLAGRTSFRRHSSTKATASCGLHPNPPNAVNASRRWTPRHSRCTPSRYFVPFVPGIH